MMQHPKLWISAAALASACVAACSSGTSGGGGAPGDTGGAPGSGGTGLSSGSGGTVGSGLTSGSGGTATSGGAASSGGSSSSGGATSSGGTLGGDAGGPTYDQVKGWVDAYKAAHPGNGGKDWDINAKTPAEIAADPAAQRLLSLCGPDQRPVIPLLAWEYGGSDHSWINPEASALVYCVYIPVKPSTSNWQFDGLVPGNVIADVYVRFPDQNPCKNSQGADQVAACVGDPTNFEILVDTASLNDGSDAGLALASASTELKLILPDGTKVHLYSNV